MVLCNSLPVIWCFCLLLQWPVHVLILLRWCIKLWSSIYCYFLTITHTYLGWLHTSICVVWIHQWLATSIRTWSPNYIVWYFIQGKNLTSISTYQTFIENYTLNPQLLSKHEEIIICEAQCWAAESNFWACWCGSGTGIPDAAKLEKLSKRWWVAFS